MPKTYELYTCYPEDDHEIYRNAYDGKIDKVIAYVIKSGVNVYQKTKFSLATPLFLALSGKHIGIIELFLDIYQADLKFIETYFQTRNVFDTNFIKKPVLIAYGANEMKLVEELYEDVLTTTKIDSSHLNGVLVLLKENNFTPKRVLYLVPRSEPEKIIVLKIIRNVLHNGQLYLNGCNNIGDSMAKVATVNGLFTVLQKLINLGCDFDAIELARLAIKSGQIQCLAQIMKSYQIDINTIVENEIVLFNLIGSGEWEMLEWIVIKLIEYNGFKENARLFWKSILDMCSDRYYGGTLYHYAIICEQIEFVEKYLAYEPNLRLPNRNGNIPIYHAFHSVKYKNFVCDMFDMDNELLQIVAGEKKCVLHLMVERNWCDVFEIVSQKYPDSKKMFFTNAEVGIATMHHAIFQNYKEIVKYVIKMYRDQIKHDDLYIFLHTAVAANVKEIVEFILTQETFDLCRPVHKGNYPLMTALCNRNIDVYLLLTCHNNKSQRNLRAIKDAENDGLLKYTIWSRDYFKDTRIYNKFNLVFNELLHAGLEWNNIGTSSGRNLVHHCALMGNDVILQRLLTLNLDTELWDAEGNLPIHYATNLSTFKMLNEKTNGRQINMKSKSTGNTPLHMLMLRNSETGLSDNLLEYLLQNGADVKTVNNLSQTPLHLVQNVNWCSILLETGSNFNTVDNKGNTPLQAALNRSNYGVAMLLFDQDSNLNESSITGFNNLAGLILHQLIMHPVNEKLARLVSTNCNIYNELGTPLLIESMHSNDYLCQIILSNPNCDINIRDKISYRTAIHATAIYNKFQLIDCLIALGANINDRDSDGNTPLHHSCQFFHEHAVDFLLRGADVNAENNNKETPLHYVALADLQGQTVCQMLLSGANLKIKNSDGNMPYDLLRDDLKQIFKNFL